MYISIHVSCTYTKVIPKETRYSKSTCFIICFKYQSTQSIRHIYIFLRLPCEIYHQPSPLKFLNYMQRVHHSCFQIYSHLISLKFLETSKRVSWYRYFF